MGIGVAIRAGLEACDMESEFSADINALRTLGMAPLAGHFRVGATQGEFRPGMVKFFSRNLLPSSGRVTRRACLGEFPVMWIAMTVAAFGEGESPIQHGNGSRDFLVVARTALYAGMFPGQRISRPIVGKFRHGLPTRLSVALIAR